MSDQEAARQAEALAQKAARARSRSQALRAQSAKMARQVAEIEDVVAETLDHLAEEHPDHADRLRAKSQAARSVAVAERLFERQEQASQPGNGGQA